MEYFVSTQYAAKHINMIIIAGYFLIRSAMSFQQGYDWSEMDWNQDGSTTISEFIVSTDIGIRTVQQNGQECTEYFAYKDGLPVKVICPKDRTN